MNGQIKIFYKLTGMNSLRAEYNNNMRLNLTKNMSRSFLI